MSFMPGSRQDKIHSEKYKYYMTYKKCQSTAFVYGGFSLLSAGAAIALGQQVLINLKYYKLSSPGAVFMAPVLGGTITSYMVTRRRTQACQNMWMALEDKHTALTPAVAPQADPPSITEE